MEEIRIASLNCWSVLFSILLGPLTACPQGPEVRF